MDCIISRRVTASQLGEFEDEENYEDFHPHECYEELICFFKELAENNGEFETGNNVIFEEDEDFVV